MIPQERLASQVRFSPRRIGHANLFVGELERSIEFYNRVCGLELVYRQPDIVSGFLSNGNTAHDIGLMQVTKGAEQRTGIRGYVQVPPGRGNVPGLNHLAWEMEHEAALVAAYQRALAAGIDINRTTDHKVVHSVYLFDPDGNMVEFYADVTKDWRSIMNLDRPEPVTGSWDPRSAPPKRERNFPMGPQIRRVPDSIFHATRTHHAVLVAQDFAAMYDFYAEIAGLSVVRETAQAAVFKAAASGWYDLVLLATRPGLTPGLHHFALEVADAEELERSIGTLGKASIALERAKDLRCSRGVFLRDPDGILVELFCRRTVDGYPTDETNSGELQPYMT